MFDLIADYADRVPLSQLSHHGGACCSTARAWFLAMDHAHRAHNPALPTWLRQFHEWGPSSWPIHWCEAIASKKLDCGSLSALSLEAFAARGKTAFLCQLIRRYDRRTIDQWRHSWGRAGCNCAWAAHEFAYHETCAIVTGNRVEIWDPSSNIMATPDNTLGYESTAALRIKGCGPEKLLWGSVEVPLNTWVYTGEMMLRRSRSQAGLAEPVEPANLFRPAYAGIKA